MGERVAVLIRWEIEVNGVVTGVASFTGAWFSSLKATQTIVSPLCGRGGAREYLL